MRKGLGNRFARLWLANGLSNMADGLLLVALTLVAARLATSATAVAAVLVFLQLPAALATLPAGAVADRVDRRVLMVAVDTVRAVVVALVTVLGAVGLLTLPALYVAAFVLGTAEVFVDATAQSTVPMLVSRERLSAANGRLVGTQMAANHFVGSPAGGVLVALALTAAFAVPAALYALAALVLLRLPGSYRAHRPVPQRLGADIREGVRVVLGQPLLRTIGLMGALLNLASAAFFSVFVLYVVGPASAMGLPESSYGLLLAGVALGAVTGAALAERAERLLGRVRLLYGTVLGLAAAYLVPVVTSAVVPVAAGLVVAGFVAMLANVIVASLRQRLVPGHLLGRVNATTRLLAVGAMPLGALVAGPLADLVGLHAVFVAAGMVTLAALPGFRVLTEAALARAEASAAAAEASASGAEDADDPVTGHGSEPLPGGSLA